MKKSARRELDRTLRCALALGGRDAVLTIVASVRKNCVCPKCDGKGTIRTGLHEPHGGREYAEWCDVCMGTGEVRVRDGVWHMEMKRKQDLHAQRHPSPKKP